MVWRICSSLAPVRVTLGYAAVLLSVASALTVLGPQAQDRVVQQLSTNLNNLGHGYLGTLAASAFVTAEGQTYLLLPGLVCLLALAELLWRSKRLVQAFALGHVGATLIVAIGLAAAIDLGWLPLSVAGDSDVGLSYGAVAVLGTLTAAVPIPWRPAWLTGWLTVATVMVASGAGFTAVGHAVALLLGVVLSVRLRVSPRWTHLRRVLLALGGAFGLLLLVGVSLPTAPLAVGAATVAATVALWMTRRRRSVATTASPIPESSSR